MSEIEILEGDALEVLATLAEASVQTCVTSPPYWGLRDYGTDGQLGLEPTPEEYVAKMVEVFRAVRRVLRDDGTVWLNLGDSYATGHGATSEGFNERWHGKHYLTDKQGDTDRERPARSAVKSLKPKDLVGIPWRVAFALQADGWYLRSDIIWSKPNPMPESVTDRPTKAHEYLFLLAKGQRYYYDRESIREQIKPTNVGRVSVVEKQGGTAFDDDGKPRAASRAYGTIKGANRRTVWEIGTVPFAAAHFAVFPPALVEPCVLAGAPAGGLVLDPFAGSGTVGVVCRKHRRRFVGIELNPEYVRMARGRIGQETVLADDDQAQPSLFSGEITR